MKKLVMVSMVLLLAAGSAHAAVTFYGEDAGTGDELVPRTDWPGSDAAKNAFIGVLGSYGFESFEGFDDGTSMDGQALLFSNGVTATFTGPMVVTELLPGTTNGLGRYPTDGVKYIDGSISQFQIDFDQNITAFGFYGIDIGDFGGESALQLFQDATPVASTVIPFTFPAEYGAVLFLGVTSADAPFNRVVITNTNPGSPTGWYDGFGYDYMIVSTSVVPAPGAILLCSLGTGVVGLLRRRRAL